MREKENQTQCFISLFLFSSFSMSSSQFYSFSPHHLLVILIKWFYLKHVLEIAGWGCSADVCALRCQGRHIFLVLPLVILSEMSSWCPERGIVMALEPCPSPGFLLMDKHPLQVDKKENKDISPPAFNWIYWEEPGL